MRATEAPGTLKQEGDVCLLALSDHRRTASTVYKNGMCSCDGESFAAIVHDAGERYFGRYQHQCAAVMAQDAARLDGETL